MPFDTLHEVAESLDYQILISAHTSHQTYFEVVILILIYFLTPANDVLGRLCFQSCLSVSQPVCSHGVPGQGLCPAKP